MKPTNETEQTIPFEVELKYRVDSFSQIELRLRELAATELAAQRQTDLYFRHPCRDFSKTDEALRIRRSNDQTYLTFKGPKLDTTTKTRREIELLVQSSDAADWESLLLSLGFNRVASVHKQRRLFRIIRADREFHVSLDAVEIAGNFVEVETISDQANLQQAQHQLQLLAAELQLGAPTRVSYLQIVLQSLQIEPTSEQ